MGQKIIKNRFTMDVNVSNANIPIEMLFDPRIEYWITIKIHQFFPTGPLLGDTYPLYLRICSQHWYLIYLCYLWFSGDYSCQCKSFCYVITGSTYVSNFKHALFYKLVFPTSRRFIGSIIAIPTDDPCNSDLVTFQKQNK